MGILNKLFKKKPATSSPAVTSPIRGQTVVKTQDANGNIVTTVISPGLANGFPDSVSIKETNRVYDLKTEAGIADITVELAQTVNIVGYECDIEYYLQRKATDYKKQGNIDLAIACLKKSNDIMALKTDYYLKKDFLRLPEYLKKAGRFDDARIEEEKIENLFSSKDISVSASQKAIENLQRHDSKLIEVSREHRICGDCAKYHDRIYSVNGLDSRFPDYALFANYLKNKTCGCSLISWPFIYGISIMRGLGESDPVSYSNRPFEDDRSETEKKSYDEYITRIQSDHKDRNDYDWLREHLPENAPKSYNGYRNMKNKNSANYQKLVLLAKEKGYLI